MKFIPLTQALADPIAPWFDDPDTNRYLGGRDWLCRLPGLMQTMPGTAFRGRQVLGRHVWVVHDGVAQPCALVDVETYSDGTAGLALVVAPERRGQGVGPRVLRAVESLDELRDVHSLIGSIEPDNHRARRCCEQAGFTVGEQPDAEGMLPIEKSLRARVRQHARGTPALGPQAGERSGSVDPRAGLL